MHSNHGFFCRRSVLQCKVYIPLRRNIPGVGGWRWAMPPTPEFCVGDTNMLVSWSQRNPTQNLKFAFYPTLNPNASQWNIGCVGSQRKMLALAMYISCFFCVYFICVWYPTRTPFPVEYGLNSLVAFSLIWRFPVYKAQVIWSQPVSFYFMFICFLFKHIPAYTTIPLIRVMFWSQTLIWALS